MKQAQSNCSKESYVGADAACVLFRIIRNRNYSSECHCGRPWSYPIPMDCSAPH